MTRFRPHLLFALLVLASRSPVSADDESKKDAREAKKEVKFGINVAQRGLWQEARFRFEQATALDPESASAFNNLGVTLEQQGEFDKARAAYERALQLEPRNTSIQQNYDLFREADEKRNRKLKKDTPAKPRETPTPDPAAPKGEAPEIRR